MKKVFFPFVLLFTAGIIFTAYGNSRTTDAGVEINGVIWATRNLDAPGTFAQNPHDAGMFFEWTSDNPCPRGWRVPTQQELQSLVNSGSTWTTRNGVNGRVFGTATRNQIFLPAAGWRRAGGRLTNVDTDGIYWSSAQNGSFVDRYLGFNSTGSNMLTGVNLAYGFSIRCVAE